ncbi:MAG TPA: hypothetical protein VK121_09195 [Pseudogracilibacillus sp.]|nr:hypothetical protein [Pseudogracilibacillus sp.]
MSLLTVYLTLESKLAMENMLKEKVYLTYYEDVSDFKNDLFLVNEHEFNEFLIDYQINESDLNQSFIILNNLNLDSFILWGESTSLNTLLNYFSTSNQYKKFIL